MHVLLQEVLKLFESRRSEVWEGLDHDQVDPCLVAVCSLQSSEYDLGAFGLYGRKGHRWQKVLLEVDRLRKKLLEN